MSPLAVRTLEVSKRYRIGRRTTYSELGDTLAETLRNTIRRQTARSSAAKDRFIWALKDVNLEIGEGQVFGIIGRNGAGKTTLLKILSEITEPTTGYAEVRGRITSFLEVGTGFHPQLTGRENIYLSGAILGMRKKEIDSKFDEIVGFAEVDRFLDTPVKFYSSGMFVRLGFAVAAFLDSDILFLDEVLAVGDYQFQQKCLQKIRSVGETGETVLFVSHNLAAIRTYCTSCLWLDEGRVVTVGNTEECISRYLQAVSEASPSLRTTLEDSTRRPGEGEAVRFSGLTLIPDHDDGKIRTGEPLRINIEFSASRPIEGVAVGFVLYADDGTAVFQCMNTDSDRAYELVPGRYAVEAVVPDNFLAEGRYVIALAARKSSEPLDWLRETLSFEVVDWGQTHAWLEPSPWGLVRAASRFGALRHVTRYKQEPEGRSQASGAE